MSIPYRLVNDEALRILYSLESNAALSVEQAVDQQVDATAFEDPNESMQEDPPFSTEVLDAKERRSFLVTWIKGILSKKEDLDAMLSRASHHWQLNRIPLIDRNILRLAIYQFKYAYHRPWKTVIQESVQLADRYGHAQSPSFINALLDRIRKELDLKEK